MTHAHELLVLSENMKQSIFQRTVSTHTSVGVDILLYYN